jgi:hypothetical protein
MQKPLVGPSAVYSEPRVVGAAPADTGALCLVDRLGDGVAIVVAIVVLLATVHWTMRLPPL